MLFKNPDLFKCEICDSKPFYKSNIQQHLKTQKHMKYVNHAHYIIDLHEFYEGLKAVNHKSIIRCSETKKPRKKYKKKVEELCEPIIEIERNPEPINFSK